MKDKSMRVEIGLLVGIGVGALGLASCSSTSSAASGVTQASKPEVSSTTKVSGTAIAKTSGGVGFNSTKTVFVLPHNAGDLPAPELALAKSDPAYASGLVDLGKWSSVTLPDPASGTSSKVWFYTGPAKNYQLSEIMSAKLDQQQLVTSLGTVAQVTGAGSKSIQVNAVQIQNPNSLSKFTVPSTDKLIAASSLELQAAPVGTHAFSAQTYPAFCTPDAFAWVNSSNQVVTISGLPTMTAGPSAVFAVSSVGPTAKIYDQGVQSCNGFQ